MTPLWLLPFVLLWKPCRHTHQEEIVAFSHVLLCNRTNLL